MPTTNENLFLSFLVTLSIMAFLGVIYLLVRHRGQVKQKIVGIEATMGSPVGVAVFTSVRILLGVAGIGVFLATLLPGLFPFLSPYFHNNVGLGGIVYIFIWPILCVQIILAFIPYSKNFIARQPIAAWFVLLVLGHMAINFDIMAMSGMYDFSR